MKNKLSFISILLALFLLGIGVYSVVGFSSGTIIPKKQNDKLKIESIDSNPKITENINKESVFVPLTSEDFIIKDENNYIELGGKNGNIKTNEKITEFFPANEHHIYQTYVFENFRITTTPEGETDSTIFCINLDTPVLCTSKGIKIGDDESEVLEKYGSVKHHDISDETRLYRYYFEDKILTIFVDQKGEVTGIRYEII